MTDYFIDSSALVKRYMPEIGTIWVRKQTAPASGNTVYVAQITMVEIMSAISRYYHDGTIDAPTLSAFRNRVLHHSSTQYRIIALHNRIALKALDLLGRYRLRAYDAIQLASVMTLNQRASGIGTMVQFIASDTRLLHAAAAEGLTVDNPNNHP